MLQRVFAIALNTYRESVRARILVGLAGVAFAVATYSIVVGAYTLKNAARAVSDLGSASVSIFSIAVAILIGATSLYRELEQKTIFPILARPISRGEYLVGKYLGTLFTLLVFIAADSGFVLFIVAALTGRSPQLVFAISGGLATLLAVSAWRWPSARTYGLIPWALLMLLAGAALSTTAPEERRVVLGGATLAMLEVAIVAAVATLFSAFSTPFLSALLTLGVFLIGRSADALASIPVKYFGQGLSAFFKQLSRVVPNLQVYVPPRPLLTGEALDAHLSTYLVRASVASVAWAILLLTVAIFIFKRRDFL